MFDLNVFHFNPKKITQEICLLEKNIVLCTKISRHLNLIHLGRISQTNKNLNRIFKEDKIWDKKLKRDYPVVYENPSVLRKIFLTDHSKKKIYMYAHKLYFEFIYKIDLLMPQGYFYGKNIENMKKFKIAVLGGNLFLKWKKKKTKSNK